MNQEKLVELLRRVPISLGVFFYLCYSGWEAYQFLNDPGSDLGLANLKVNQAKEESRKVQIKIAELREFALRLEGKKIKIRELASSLKDTQTTFSDHVDLAEIMRMLFTEAKRSGVNVMALAPSGEETGDYFASSKFRMTVRGIFGQIVDFLDRIASTNQILKSEQVEMHTTGVLSKKYAQLESVIEIKTYRYVRSKADSIDGKSPSSVPTATSIANLGSKP